MKKSKIFTYIFYLSFLFSCKKITEPSTYNFTYIYLNNLDIPVNFNVNYTNNVEVYKLMPQDSIVFKNSQKFPGVFETVKSVSFKFANELKCTTYLNTNDGNITILNQGIFNFKNYQNYNPPIKLQNTTFRYNIDAKDLALAKACE